MGFNLKRDEDEIPGESFHYNKDYFAFDAGLLTSDLGVQRRDIGTVSMSEALQVFLYSQEGNLTVAMPSCSFMDMTMPTLPSTPLPTTCRGAIEQEICLQ